MSDSEKSKKELINEVKKLRRMTGTLKRRIYAAADHPGDFVDISARAIADALGGHVYLTDDRYRLRFINSSLRELLGVDAVGERCHKAVFGRDARCSWCPMDTAATAKQVRFEKKNPLDGRWYYMTYAPMLSRNGTSLTLAHWFDLSPWKQKEESLKEYRRELESLLEERTGSILAMNRMLQGEMAVSEERARELRFKDLTIRSSVNAVAFADGNGIVTYVNDFFMIMWGLEDENEARGRPLDRFWNSTAAGESLMARLKGGGSWLGEIRAVRKDGSVFDSLVSAALVGDESTGDVRILCTSVDISERKKAER